MQRVYNFLTKAKTFYFGTSHDGQPEIRPFGAIMIFEDKLYIQTGMSKDVFKQLKENPLVTICAFDGSEWVRVNATAVPDYRDEPAAAILEECPSLKGMYAVGDGNHVVVYLRDATVRFCGFGKEEERYTF